MRIRRILCLAAAILVSQLTLAKLPLANDQFGRAEGLFDFCVQADPSSAAQYQERKSTLVRGVPEKEVADARKTQEYRNGYGQLTSELGKLSEEQAVATCSAILRTDK
jgi:hypothetical protein